MPGMEIRMGWQISKVGFKVALRELVQAAHKANDPRVMQSEATALGSGSGQSRFTRSWRWFTFHAKRSCGMP